jgi:hypothetical protein
MYGFILTQKGLKPNSEKKSNYFVDEEMKHQIKYLVNSSSLVHPFSRVCLRMLE